MSLGKLAVGSGYCVGAVVETRMGVKLPKKDGKSKYKGYEAIYGGVAGEIAGNGMRDVWVIGEPFFRGVGGAFDFKTQEVGFRSY